jgi:5-methylcytosine-specific restriction enzyme A
MKNPNWTKDELILALELYFRDPTARGNKKHPEVINLSRLLNRLPIHSDNEIETNFRNPTGVAMKLGNFLRFDPSYTGKGLERGNKMEEEVWNLYSSDIPALVLAKDAIVNNIGFIEENRTTHTPDFIEEASEGRLLTKVHVTRERNQSIIKRKKKSVLKETGSLKCEVCSFDFKQVYGELGEGFAECHHVKPVSQLKPNETTKIKDLAILCANCHRMIHRERPWKTIEELKALLRN